MCNINILWKEKEITPFDLPFWEAATYNSFLDNKHGEGYLTPQGIQQSLGKIVYAREPLAHTKWIVSHQRLATHGGINLTNTQPLNMEHIVFIHNGIMQTDDVKGKSDSRIVGEKINDLMNKGQDFTRSFLQVMNEVAGSKSIVCYDKSRKKLYYYKNSSTSFYLVRGKHMFYASTSKENAEYARQYYRIGKPFEPKAGILYEILEDGSWQKRAKVKEAKMVYTYTKCDDWKGFVQTSGGKYGGYNRNMWEDELDEGKFVNGPAEKQPEDVIIENALDAMGLEKYSIIGTDVSITFPKGEVPFPGLKQYAHAHEETKSGETILFIDKMLLWRNLRRIGDV